MASSLPMPISMFFLHFILGRFPILISSSFSSTGNSKYLIGRDPIGQVFFCKVIYFIDNIPKKKQLTLMKADFKIKHLFKMAKHKLQIVSTIIVILRGERVSLAYYCIFTPLSIFYSSTPLITPLNLALSMSMAKVSTARSKIRGDKESPLVLTPCE